MNKAKEILDSGKKANHSMEVVPKKEKIIMINSKLKRKQLDLPFIELTKYLNNNEVKGIRNKYLHFSAHYSIEYVFIPHKPLIVNNVRVRATYPD
ncbi:MAG: hypothetical protein R2753_06660 [Chitinophagales bacterium]